MTVQLRGAGLQSLCCAGCGKRMALGSLAFAHTGSPDHALPSTAQAGAGCGDAIAVGAAAPRGLLRLTGAAAWRRRRGRAGQAAAAVPGALPLPLLLHAGQQQQPLTSQADQLLPGCLGLAKLLGLAPD